MASVSLFLLTFVAGLSAINAADSVRPWQDYRAIMWVGDSANKKPEKLPLFYQRLREMGINTAMVYDGADPKPLLENKFPYYVENIVNKGLCLKFNSKVTDWDKFVTEWARGGWPDSALVRDYCLDDPQWQTAARKQMQETASIHRDHQPLAYDIRDELSTTISANPFDYDFNPISLGAFREWLRTQYRDLDALNAEWETKFAHWEDVKPFTTDQIKNRMASGDAQPRGKPDWQQLAALKFDPVTAQSARTRWNFSPWADFRTYMDISLARALDRLRHAAQEIDRATPVGIEGTQMPNAFGGYDLWRLSQVLDWIEPYDIGNAREIFGSFMTNKPILTTVFESDTKHASRRLWHLLLEGDRGCIVWWSEDCIDWKTEDYQLTPKAKALAPVLKEVTSRLAELFLRATREYDPIYFLYSQPSIQVDWLQESTIDGSTWLRRFSSYEAEHNQVVRTRDGWLKMFQDTGYSPRFVTGDQLVSLAVAESGPTVLVLPTAWALSDGEVMAVRRFLGTGKRGKADREVFCDGTPGLFDEHGKLRQANGLDDYFPVSAADQPRAAGAAKNLATPTRGVASYLRKRLEKGGPSVWPDWVKGQTDFMRPPIAVSPSACIRTHRYRVGAHRLVAFERNVDYHMSEDLKQAGGNESLEQPIEVEAKLAKPVHIYDLRTEKYLGLLDQIRFRLDPWEPSLFALTEEKLRERSVLDELRKNATADARTE